MKKLLNNKKGFTLIELLAVIVILAILVMVAIPAVTKYLNAARRGTFADNANTAIGEVRKNFIIDGQKKTEYSINEINEFLEKDLLKSPFGACYCADSKVTVSYNGNSAIYSIILKDSTGRGITSLTEEKALDAEKVNITPATSGTCTKLVDGCTES